jgi:uncharacterized protein YndB with AHSA1/START domain
VPQFSEERVTDARPFAVWKLLHDPARFPDWWAGTLRVEAGEDGLVTRYMQAWPDFPYPTSVRTVTTGSRVVISCLVSDTGQEWSIDAAGDGCRVRVVVDVPDAQADRADRIRAETAASITNLVRLAEHDA